MKVGSQKYKKSRLAIFYIYLNIQSVNDWLYSWSLWEVGWRHRQCYHPLWKCNIWGQRSPGFLQLVLFQCKQAVVSAATVFVPHVETWPPRVIMDPYLASLFPSINCLLISRFCFQWWESVTSASEVLTGPWPSSLIQMRAVKAAFNVGDLVSQSVASGFCVCHSHRARSPSLTPLWFTPPSTGDFLFFFFFFGQTGFQDTCLIQGILHFLAQRAHNEGSGSAGSMSRAPNEEVIF